MRGAAKAAIDLGTNTALMVIGRRAGDRIDLLADEHAIVRLGQGVDAQGQLSPQAMDRACRQLVIYAARARSLGATHIAAWGTSALRDATNRTVLIERIEGACGIELRPLSGEQEAHLTFRGAAWGFDISSTYAVVDIGGGSTEIAWGSADQLQHGASFDIGAVRLSERFFPLLPPTASQIERARSTVVAALRPLPALPDGIPLLGVAGTAIVLAALDAQSEDFADPNLNGHYLSAQRIHSLCEDLLELDYEELSSRPAIGTARADIIGAGALILREVVQKSECPGIVVSRRGIRYALLEAMLS